MGSIYPDIYGPGCVFWSRKTSDAPVRPCGALKLVEVTTRKKTVLMCHTHRKEFVETGRIRYKKAASLPYSSRQYRP